MSNLEKVLRILVDMKGARDMLDVAEKLEAEGLLAPDLPESTPNKYDPDADPYWKVRLKQGDQITVTSSCFGGIYVTDLGVANVTGARTLALALLAAADCAEKMVHDE